MRNGGHVSRRAANAQRVSPPSPLVEFAVEFLRERSPREPDRLVVVHGDAGPGNVLWDGEVAPGFTAEPKRDPVETRAIAEYNERVASHPELITAIVPLRDGVSISVKRSTGPEERR